MTDSTERRCVGCDGALPPMTYQGNPRKWCSQSCRLRTARFGSGLVPDAACVYCGQIFSRKTLRQTVCTSRCSEQHRRAAKRITVAPRACQGCGEQFTPTPNNASRAMFCSMRCGRPYYNQIRKARLLKAWVDDVIPLRVFERDGWICHICSEAIDRTVQYPDNKSPSLDHFIPLCAGGEHSYANCRAAHMQCNSIKQARVKYPTRVMDAVPDTGGSHAWTRTGTEAVP